MFTTTTRYSSQSNDVHPIYLGGAGNQSTFAPLKRSSMHIAQRVLFLTLLFLGAAGTLSAQSTWTGASNTDWGLAANYCLQNWKKNR